MLLRNEERQKRSELERKLSKRYHKVRFFERVKVERKIKRIKKSLSEGSDRDHQALGALQQLKNDLTYIKFFPKGERYISLFPQGELSPEQIAK